MITQWKWIRAFWPILVPFVVFLLWAHLVGTSISLLGFLLLSTISAGAILTLLGQKKVAEETVRRLSTAVEHSPVSLMITDTSGAIQYVNKRFLHGTGYSLSEVLGRNPGFMKVGDVPEEIYRNLWTTITSGGVWQGVFHNRRKNGEAYWAKASIAPLRGSGKRITGYIAVREDITGQKLAESKLMETNSNLEMASARAESLAAQAQLANAAKSEFLANMSHEIRTPMNGVIGMAGLLLDTDLDPEQRRYAEIVRSSGESLLALLNDILDFSKIEAGKLEMESLEFDLRLLLDDLSATLALRMHNKGLEFICAAAPEIPSCLRGDPGRLRQVLNNLASNAIKFTRDGEICLRTRLVSETEEEVCIRFSIADTGVGIPADAQAKLFQKFTQADASITREFGGTGLGLAISKQLVELMGGEIGLISPVNSPENGGGDGRGSEFWFTARFGRSTPQEPAATADVRGAHLLLVDDNATSREAMMAQFDAWGMRAEAAEDGPRGLHAVARAQEAGDPFQVVILDMRMPGMDGAAVAARLKADETLRHIPLVLMPSISKPGDGKRMAEIGFAAYLPKPARHFELLGVLATVLGQVPQDRPQPIVTRHSIRERRKRSVRILLAEDNITNQQVALAVLKKQGFRADVAANGLEVLKALEDIPYDLVLMDVQMPEMDGLSATSRIRDPTSEVLNHRIPIIAMTANAMKGDLERCLAVGMDDYLSKPLAPRALAAILDKWIREKPYPSGVAEAPTPIESQSRIFDRAGFLERLYGDEDLAKSVARTFQEDIRERISALQAILDAGDSAGAARISHAIRGASANVGGRTLSAAAAELERSAKDNDMDEARAGFRELESQFAALCREMSNLEGPTVGTRIREEFPDL